MYIEGDGESNVDLSLTPDKVSVYTGTFKSKIKNKQGLLWYDGVFITNTTPFTRENTYSFLNYIICPINKSMPFKNFIKINNNSDFTTFLDTTIQEMKGNGSRYFNFIKKYSK